MRKLILLILFSVFMLTSCGNAGSPDPINFGSDLCVHCNMKIMDKRFGAEIMNENGKAFKFDAAECMFNYMSVNSMEKAAYWVIDYSNPGTFANAKNAFYLISPGIKSPMGENLSCFAVQRIAEDSKTKNTGTLYNWDEIRQKLGSGK